MNVTLLHYTPLSVCSYAIRTCWDSHSKSNKRADESLIFRVGNVNKHKSVLEHLVYSFDIQNISRACLQELARHRIASLSVKSTRYTLKELNKEESFLNDNNAIERAKKYIKLQNDQTLDSIAMQSLESLRVLLKSYPNDKAKYVLPECYLTSLVWTINARSLQNFLTLRTAKVAFKEIQDLAFMIYKNLPSEHLYLFNECLSERATTD